MAPPGQHSPPVSVPPDATRLPPAPPLAPVKPRGEPGAQSSPQEPAAGRGAAQGRAPAPAHGEDPKTPHTHPTGDPARLLPSTTGGPTGRRLGRQSPPGQSSSRRRMLRTELPPERGRSLAPAGGTITPAHNPAAGSRRRPVPLPVPSRPSRPAGPRGLKRARSAPARPRHGARPREESPAERGEPERGLPSSSFPPPRAPVAAPGRRLSRAVRRGAPHAAATTVVRS